jgi:hypothetical protein
MAGGDTLELEIINAAYLQLAFSQNQPRLRQICCYIDKTLIVGDMFATDKTYRLCSPGSTLCAELHALFRGNPKGHWSTVAQMWLKGHGLCG